MALKITSALHHNVTESDRMEPRFHHVHVPLENYCRVSNLDIRRFGDLILEITDGEHAGQTFVEEGVRFVKNSAVKDFQVDLFDGFFITPEKQKQQKRSALKTHDILFTTIGKLGSATIIPDNFGEANINQNVVRIVIDKKILNPFYLVAYLNSNVVKKQINALFTGNLQPILTYPKIKDLKIILPSKKIQDDIASKYESVTKIREDSLKLIEKARRVYYDALAVDFSSISRKICFSTSASSIINNDLWTPDYCQPLYVKSNTAIKNKNSSDSLGNLVSIFTGDEPGSKNYVKYLDKSDTDVPFIRTSDLLNFEIDSYPDNFIPNSIQEELSQKFLAGDLLFSKDGRIGNCAMLTESDSPIIGTGIIGMRLNEKARELNLSAEYLFIVLSTMETGKYPAIRRTVFASTLPHLRQERIEDFTIPILGEKELSKIKNMVKKAFDMKEKSKKIISEIRNFLDSNFDIE